MPGSNKQRSKSAPRPPRPRGQFQEADVEEAPSLQRHSVPRPPPHGGRGSRGGRGAGGSLKGPINVAGWELGFPMDEFCDPASMQQYRLFDCVHKYSSDSSDDQTGPYHASFGPRGCKTGTSFSDMRTLYESLILPWSLDFPLGRAPKESRQQSMISASNPSGAFKRTVAWMMLVDRDFMGTVHEMYGSLPYQLRYLLRLDLFGNVISKEAISGSLCFFNLDHIFPKTRGGYTVNSNLIALSFIVNRCKGSAIVNGLVKVYKDREAKSVERDLMVMEPTNNLPLRIVELKQGIRAFHITRIWEIACSSMGLDPAEMQLPDSFLTEVLIVLRFLLCTPWSWHEQQKINPLSSTLSPSSRSPLQPHHIPHLKGHVSVLHAMLTAMSATITWLPNVLAYVFPPGHAFKESPLFSTGIVAEAAGSDLPEEDESLEVECSENAEDASLSEPRKDSNPFSVLQAPSSLPLLHSSTPTRSRSPLEPLGPIRGPPSQQRSGAIDSICLSSGSKSHTNESGRLVHGGNLDGRVTVSDLISTSVSQSVADDREGGYVVVYRPSFFAKWFFCHGKQPV